MTTRILTGLAFALALACGRIDLGSYGMGGMTSNTDDDQAEQDNGQRPPDVIIIGPVTSETTLEPANPETTRPGEDESIVPSDEQSDDSLPSGVGELDAGAARDAGADGGVVDAG